MIVLLKDRFRLYFRQNILLFVVITLFFIIGIVFGSLGAAVMGEGQQQELALYIDDFLKTFAGTQLDQPLIVKQAIFDNIVTITKIWFLGLTVIGVPLILVIIFAEGFMLGFTVGFLIQEKALKGIIMVLLTVLPQNVLNIVALIMGGVAAITFSVYLIRGRHAPRTGYLLKQFIAYSMLMCCYGLLAVLAALFEGYVSPMFIRLIAMYLS